MNLKNKAEVSTITVEIKTIVIGNKQMTLSVFDQLVNEPPFDESYCLSSNLWGKVKRKGEFFVIHSKNNKLMKYSIDAYEGTLSYKAEFPLDKETPNQWCARMLHQRRPILGITEEIFFDKKELEKYILNNVPFLNDQFQKYDILKKNSEDVRLTLISLDQLFIAV